MPNDAQQPRHAAAAKPAKYVIDDDSDDEEEKEHIAARPSCKVAAPQPTIATFAFHGTVRVYHVF